MIFAIERVTPQWLCPSSHNVKGFTSVHPFPTGSATDKHTAPNSSPTPLTKWMNHAKWAKHVCTDGFLETQGLKWVKHPTCWWVTRIYLKKTSNQCRNRPCKPYVTNILQNDIKELLMKVKKKTFQIQIILNVGNVNFWSRLPQPLWALQAHLLLIGFETTSGLVWTMRVLNVSELNDVRPSLISLRTAVFLPLRLVKTFLFNISKS